MVIKLIVGLIIVFAGFLALRLYVSHLCRGELPLNLNKRILSVEEQKFLNQLQCELGSEYFIMPKIRFVDFSHLDSMANVFVKLAVKWGINNLCADFVVCRKKDSSIFSVVELEKLDKSRSKKERREKVISSMCDNMGIKLYYFDPRQDYSAIDIRRLITGKRRSTADQKIPSTTSVLTNSTVASVEAKSIIEDLSKVKKKHTCPKCYAEVITKMAVKGNSIGEKFLMCRKYPYCDYQVPLADESVKEIQKKANASFKKAGYTKW